MTLRTFLRVAFATLGFFFAAATTMAQETSVKPGINDAFRNPDAKEFTERFEVESREVYSRRKEIVAACEIKPGMAVADIGAGTGLFTRLFAEAVGPEGKVLAVDIAQNFLDHIEKSAREVGLKNVETVLASVDSTGLPPASVDLAFICDTYHHFEFPHKTMTSLHRALKPGGRVVLIDFRREPGRSTDWVLDHVRAGQHVFESEIIAAGFRKVSENADLLKENYFVVFEKADIKPATDSKASGTQRVFPIIAGYGGVAPRSGTIEPPRAGARVVIDATLGGKPEELNKSLERVARLLNLYGAAGLKGSDITIAIVLHGEATGTVLGDAAYQTKFGPEKNPNLPLIRALQAAGVEVSVCGQAMANHGYADADIAAEIPISTSALTTVMNKQADGYTTIVVP